MAWPFVAAAIGSAALGGLSYLSNKETNKTNKQIADEANDLQYQMFQEANDFSRNERLETQDFNRNMWYEQQVYNSPYMQSERLKLAGLNPSALLGGDSASAYGSVQSSPASSVGVPGAHVAQMSNEFDARVMGSLADTIVNLADKQQDIQGKAIDNEMRYSKNLAEIDSLIASKYKQLSDSNLSKGQLESIYESIKNLQVQRDILNVNLNNTLIRNNYTDQEMQFIMQRYRDEHEESSLRVAQGQLAMKLGIEQNSREWKRLYGDLDLIRSNVRMNEQSIDESAERVKKIIEEKTGLKFTNEMNSELRSIMVDEAKGNHEAWKISNWYDKDIGYQAQERFWSRVTSLLPFGSGYRPKLNNTSGTNP